MLQTNKQTQSFYLHLENFENNEKFLLTRLYIFVYKGIYNILIMCVPKHFQPTNNNNNTELNVTQHEPIKR